MKYVLARTQAEGKKWANPFQQKFKVLSTRNHIVGRAFDNNDTIFILDRNPMMIECLLPSLKGCQVYNL